MECSTCVVHVSSLTEFRDPNLNLGYLLLYCDKWFGFCQTGCTSPYGEISVMIVEPLIQCIQPFVQQLVLVGLGFGVILFTLLVHSLQAHLRHNLT